MVAFKKKEQKTLYITLIDNMNTNTIIQSHDQTNTFDRGHMYQTSNESKHETEKQSDRQSINKTYCK